MLRTKFFLFASLSIVIFFFCAFIPPVFTQQPPSNFDATVSPVFFDLTNQENTVTNQTIRLRNNTSSDLTLKAEVKKMGADDLGDLTIKDQDDGTISWIEINNPKITIKPKEWVNVQFLIKIPKEAAFGYYWAISFTQDSGQTLKTSGARLNAAIVVPVLLNVPKNGATMQGKILNFSTDSFYYEYPPVTFKTIFSNTGNIHVRPVGNIFIKDWMGKTIGSVNVNGSQGAVLPDMKRKFESEWNDSFITYVNKMQDGEVVVDKSGTPKKELKIRFDKILDLRIGKYTATTLLVINGEKRDIAYEASTSFFIFPWKIVLGGLIFIVFAGVGLFSTTKSIIRRVKKLFGRKKTNT
jgi:hypothetical protein